MKSETLVERILKAIRESGGSLKLNELSKILGIGSDSIEYPYLRETLDILVESGEIEKSSRRKYSLPFSPYEGGITGIIEISDDAGVVFTDDPDFPKIVVKRKNLFTSLNGDKVLVQLLAQKKNKKKFRGEVIKVIERNQGRIVGTVDFDGDFYFLIPDEAHHYVDFLIPPNKLNGADEGDKVAAEFLQWDNPTKSPTVEVTQIIGKAGDPSAEFEAIIQEFNLPEEFNENVVAEAEIVKAPTNRKVKDRLDLREELIITIDPIDAKDFDDALSLKIMDNGNYYLGVHIADVSHYVRENSEMDIEARLRGNSIYLVDRVIPMLPEQISNEVCSLKPDVPRFAYSVFMELSPSGVLKNYEIHETLIRSKRRYNYDEVQEIINTGKGDNLELIIQLNILAKILRTRRFKAGGIEFDTTETKFILDENKYPVDVKLRRTTDATSLVEECMLIANQTVASHVRILSQALRLPQTLPFLYRVHDEPDPKILAETLEFIGSFGPKLKTKKPSSNDINKLIHDVEQLPEKSVVHQILIRSMAKAIYSDFNNGHYGLGFDEYAHFTSPIRRYPDLIVHRLLKEYNKAIPDISRLKFISKLLKEVGGNCTNRERLAMEAERASNKLAGAMIAENKIGEEFFGTITGVTNFGLFVTIEGLYVEGLLHIKDIWDDYYIYDEAKYRIIGKRKKKIFGLGMKIRVKIIKVNIDKRNIDLAFVEA